MPRGGLRHIEDSREIYRDHLVPLFGSDVEKVVANANAGVVDEDIDRAHCADRLGESGFDLLQVSHVGDDGLRYFRELPAKRVASFGVAVENTDVRAFFEKASGSGRADAAGAAGDQDSFVGQAPHEDRSRFSVFGECCLPRK